MFDTLEEAVELGRGVERPFRCPEHEDKVASASVNVLKGVWFCFGCQARGSVDAKKKAPSDRELAAMLNPEKDMRTYALAYLELYCWHEDIYWNDRHEPWVSYSLGMGSDPFTGDATFAVHSPTGRLAGVGRRHVVTDDETGKKSSRYLYPPRWSSARSIGGAMGRYPSLPVLCLVEGMADAAAVWQTGCPGIAVYGAGLHQPQLELISRMNPEVILLGFDTDEAGERAVSAAYRLLGRRYTLERVRWSKKDPSAMTEEARTLALLKAVGRLGYGDVREAWRSNRDRLIQKYNTHLEEDHAA